MRFWGSLENFPDFPDSAILNASASPVTGEDRAAYQRQSRCPAWKC